MSKRRFVVNKSQIVFGPAGCGKSTRAKAIARHYGLTAIVDDWRGAPPFNRFDTLYLTSLSLSDLQRLFPEHRRVVAFASLPADVRA